MLARNVFLFLIMMMIDKLLTLICSRPFARIPSCVILLSVVTSCAIDTATPRDATVVAAPQAAPANTAADALINAIRTLQNMTPAALSAEKEAAREIFERDPAQFRRVRYLLALYVAAATAADDDKLSQLLEPVLGATQNDNDLSLSTLVNLMQQAVSARKKLRDDINQINRRLALATASANNNSKRDDRDAESRVLKLRVEELEKQLAAMKSIDKSVTRR